MNNKIQIFINNCEIKVLTKKMANRCVYCKCDLDARKALSVCKSCGVKVWGLKMYEAIDSQMNDAKETGNLEQGNIA
ncbi:hypothetical protein FJZ17_02440 [Candidatus Pacearchaeota archaeon]|nr:hypothetical protein [Candidatus Pacearchaeota archaeon]